MFVSKRRQQSSLPIKLLHYLFSSEEMHQVRDPQFKSLNLKPRKTGLENWQCTPSSDLQNMKIQIFFYIKIKGYIIQFVKTLLFLPVFMLLVNNHHTYMILLQMWVQMMSGQMRKRRERMIRYVVKTLL